MITPSSRSSTKSTLSVSPRRRDHHGRTAGGLDGRDVGPVQHDGVDVPRAPRRALAVAGHTDHGSHADILADAGGTRARRTPGREYLAQRSLSGARQRPLDQVLGTASGRLGGMSSPLGRLSEVAPGVWVARSRFYAQNSTVLLDGHGGALVVDPGVLRRRARRPSRPTSALGARRGGVATTDTSTTSCGTPTSATCPDGLMPRTVRATVERRDELLAPLVPDLPEDLVDLAARLTPYDGELLDLERPDSAHRRAPRPRAAPPRARAGRCRHPARRRHAQRRRAADA